MSMIPIKKNKELSKIVNSLRKKRIKNMCLLLNDLLNIIKYIIGKMHLKIIISLVN